MQNPYPENLHACEMNFKLAGAVFVKKICKLFKCIVILIFLYALYTYPLLVSLALYIEYYKSYFYPTSLF